jgi:dihydroorotase
MKLLIKQARVADPSSPFHDQSVDLFIDNGFIEKINPKKFNADREIAAKGHYVSPGWVDVFADFGDPGYEFRETLESGAAAAAAGGFTDVLIIPNTNPVVHTKGSVEYVVQKSRNLPTRIHPLGAITRNAEGKELSEMYDMRASGAKAFSDGVKPVQSSGLLLKALQYVKAFQGTIIQVPDDTTINPQGLMNEGIVSTRLGLPGKPALSESLLIARDISLAEYAQSNLHFTGISTAESLQLIQEAKTRGVHISCSVTPHHLVFTDEDMQDYDTNLKVNPPLRTARDREALRSGLKDGRIDCIATHHFPHEPDAKILEFEYAKFGMIALQTAFAAMNTAVEGITPSQWAQLFSLNPRKLFGLEEISIREGARACLTFFDTTTTWAMRAGDIRSRSRNSPFIGKELKGKVAGIVNNDFCSLS